MNVGRSELNVEPSAPRGAVFLSYASQDAQAARRMCEALRAVGVEVWFDQNELVGGDAWDAKIRGQIASCALFVPLISANTQARLEGYFRLEWKLAAQRTHTMADEKTFLLPVVIDATRDAEAKVPVEFKAVQWTKLPGGETPEKFCTRVKALLGGGDAAPSGSAVGARLVRAQEEGRGRATPLQKSSRPWLVPAILGAAAIVALALWQPWKKSAAASPAVSASPAAPLSEAQKLVEQARQILETSDPLNRENLYLAEEFAKRALALEPANPDAWLVSARISYHLTWLSIDNSAQRRELLVQQAKRAVALAPRSTAARLTLLNAQGEILAGAKSDTAAAALEAEARALVTAEPDNGQAHRTLGTLLRYFSKRDEAVAEHRKAYELSRGDPEAAADLINVLVRGHQVEEADAIRARAMGQRTSGRLLCWDAMLKLRWWGDPEAAREALKRWPGWLGQEDRGLFQAWQTWMWSRKPGEALSVARVAVRDMVRDFSFSGPVAALRARAHELAGNAEAARADWQTTLERANRELAVDPDNEPGLYWKAWSLARLGRVAEARPIAATLSQRNQQRPSTFFTTTGLEPLQLVLGDKPAALAGLRRRLTAMDDGIGLTRPMLELDPDYDSLRDDPEFQAILRDAPASRRSALTQSGDKPAPAEKSVAVLAFDNRSDDREAEYFSDGISEEVINALSRVSGLTVKGRTSAFSFKGSSATAQEIGEKLGVAYLVRGSVRKAGNTVRITAQLSRAATDEVLWAPDPFTRELKDVFAVQDEIVKNIVTAVKGRLAGEAELPRAVTTKIEAYTLFLQAQGAFAKRGDSNLREAIKLFDAALAIDPGYLPAMVGAAQAHSVLPLYATLSGTKAREQIDAAARLARRAVEIDPRNALAHSVTGFLLMQYDWQWTEGLAALLRARDLAPGDSWMWNSLGDAYRFMGDLPNALAAKQRAWELDPLSAVSHWDLAFVHLVARNTDRATGWAEKSLELAPNIVDGYLPAIFVADQAGRADRMRETIAKARKNTRDGEGQLLLLEARAAILEHQTADARRMLTAAEALAEKGESSPAWIGFTYLQLGDAEKAAQWLRRAFDERDPFLVENAFTDFDPIAANPVTRPILDQPGLKELYELRRENARAGRNKL